MAGLLERLRLHGGGGAVDGRADEVLNASTRVTIRQLLELRAHAGQIDLKRRQPARAQLAGNHESRFRGRGMDYQESRAYQPGDDIRNMDWRVTARAGRPHTKLFQEERERPVIFLVDLSPSMFFATRGALKAVIAARAATLLAWAGAAQGDRIGALLCNGGHHELKPRSRHRGVLQLIHAIVEQADPLRTLAAPPAGSSLGEALTRMRRIARPGSLVFCISDFFALDEEGGNSLLRLRQHNDVVAMRITDPIERVMPPPGRYGVTDGREAGILDTGSRDGRHQYREFFAQRELSVRELLQRSDIPLMELSTADNVVLALQARFGRTRTFSSARRGAA